MPSFTTEGKTLQYATEEQVRDFANKVRAKGGANMLETLLPGDVNEERTCLIANALNFNSQVVTTNTDAGAGNYVWIMELPTRFSKKRAQEIADAVDCEVVRSVYNRSGWAIKLPTLIGNAAHAFDVASRGWVTQYRNESDDNE